MKDRCTANKTKSLIYVRLFFKQLPKTFLGGSEEDDAPTFREVS